MFAFKKNNIGTDCDPVAREIAERCAAVTLPQLTAAAGQMSASQLRGYVRAHAWPQVWDETETASASSRLTKAERNDLAARALEQTVHLVMCAYRSAPVVAIPSPHIGRRAA